MGQERSWSLLYSIGNCYIYNIKMFPFPPNEPAVYLPITNGSAIDTFLW